MQKENLVSVEFFENQPKEKRIEFYDGLPVFLVGRNKRDQILLFFFTERTKYASDEPITYVDAVDFLLKMETDVSDEIDAVSFGELMEGESVPHSVSMTYEEIRIQFPWTEEANYSPSALADAFTLQLAKAVYAEMDKRGDFAKSGAQRPLFQSLETLYDLALFKYYLENHPQSDPAQSAKMLPNEVASIDLSVDELLQKDSIDLEDAIKGNYSKLSDDEKMTVGLSGPFAYLVQLLAVSLQARNSGNPNIDLAQAASVIVAGIVVWVGSYEGMIYLDKKSRRLDLQEKRGELVQELLLLIRESEEPELRVKELEYKAHLMIATNRLRHIVSIKKHQTAKNKVITNELLQVLKHCTVSSIESLYLFSTTILDEQNKALKKLSYAQLSIVQDEFHTKIQEYLSEGFSQDITSRSLKELSMLKEVLIQFSFLSLRLDSWLDPFVVNGKAIDYSELLGQIDSVFADLYPSRLRLFQDETDGDILDMDDVQRITEQILSKFLGKD